MKKHQELAAEGNAREETLHQIAIQLADLNIEAQLEVAIPTLEFLKDIEEKTADDQRKVKNQERLIEILESEDYRSRLEYEFTDKFSKLSPRHLETYLEDLEYNRAIEELNFELSPALAALQEELVSGSLNKVTLQ